MYSTMITLKIRVIGHDYNYLINCNQLQSITIIDYNYPKSDQQTFLSKLVTGGNYSPKTNLPVVFFF